MRSTYRYPNVALRRHYSASNTKVDTMNHLIRSIARLTLKWPIILCGNGGLWRPQNLYDLIILGSMPLKLPRTLYVMHAKTTVHYGCCTSPHSVCMQSRAQAACSSQREMVNKVKFGPFGIQGGVRVRAGQGKQDFWCCMFPESSKDQWDCEINNYYIAVQQ